MEPDIQKKLEEQDAKLEAIYVSVEKIRKYLLITAWVTLAVVVLPAIGLVFIIPAFINSYTSTFEGLL